MNEKFDVFTLHKKIIQANQLSTMLSDDITRQRSLIDSTIQQYIYNLRTFCFLDTWYLRLSMADVSQFLQSAIKKRSISEIYKNPSSLPYNTKETLKINNILKSFPNYHKIFLECVSIYFNSNHSDPEYDPCDKALTFFASSTLPSLFGYCWCVEQGSQYIDVIIFLLQVEMQKKDLLSSDFRNSYVKEIIRQFMNMSGYNIYLHTALSSNYWKLINDENLNKSALLNTPGWFEILANYVKEFEDELYNSIQILPLIVRYFFKKISSIDQSGLLIEYIFFDYLLQPAILNPKLYNLIPETAPSPSTLYLTSITRLIKWSLHPDLIQPEFNFVKTDIPSFQKINMRRIITTISKCEGSVYGIYSSVLSGITDGKCHLLLISVNDILFITKIINETIDKITNHPPETITKLKKMCEIDITLKKGEIIELWFHTFKTPPIPDDLIKPPDHLQKMYLPLIQTKKQKEIEESNIDIKEKSKTQTPEEIEFSKTIKHLINYFKGLSPSPNKPRTLPGFLNYMAIHSSQIGSTEWQTKTHAIRLKLKYSNKTVDEILQALVETIDNDLYKSSNLLKQCFHYQQSANELIQVKDQRTVLSDSLSPILHQSIIKLYINRHSEIINEVNENRAIFLKLQSKWFEFLDIKIKDLLSFSLLLGLNKSNCYHLIKQFHSTLCQNLPLYDFKLANQEYLKNDKMINDDYDQLLKSFVKNTKSSNMKILFKIPNYFDHVVKKISIGSKYGAPLERLEQIDESIQMIKKLYLLEIGEECSKDDLNTLLIYVILLARIPDLDSLSKYIEHFLISKEETVVILNDDEQNVVQFFLNGASQVQWLIFN
ncbi:hypothetical protein M9Y10_022911 [Tritrichomonas musculus]|uniref:VPS9 domain-containing protein n=1 Tax=Tritrichomonas musculus TaxID=1915356 RepID=A0ABR2KU90_9EUKA